ncbi:MAG TPA: DUF1236 domain-containing protein [Microvirga sp.]|nr:DUF1236 domain-containing protein [Microvirga sp.]
MKSFAIAAVMSLGLVSAAAAQSATTTTTSGGTAVTTGSTSTTVTIQPEVRTKVKQYVTTSKPKAVTVPSGFTVSTGAVLPETVEVQSFPSDVGVTQYRYAVIGDQTVLVEPGSRRIVEVIR